MPDTQNTACAHSQPRTERLLEAARLGDPSATIDLFLEFQGLVRAEINANLPREARALESISDVEQRLRCKYWQAVEGGGVPLGDLTALRRWLRVAAKNAAIDAVKGAMAKRRAAQKTQSLDASWNHNLDSDCGFQPKAPEADSSLEHRLSILGQVLDELPESARWVMDRLGEGLTEREIVMAAGDNADDRTVYECWRKRVAKAKSLAAELLVLRGLAWQELGAGKPLSKRAAKAIKAAQRAK